MLVLAGVIGGIALGRSTATTYGPAEGSIDVGFLQDMAVHHGQAVQAPHWGYVLAGKVTFKSSSGEETFEAGDAYFVPAGHTPVLYAGAEVVEFSPTEQLQQTLDVVAKNMEAAG